MDPSPVDGTERSLGCSRYFHAILALGPRPRTNPITGKITGGHHAFQSIWRRAVRRRDPGRFRRPCPDRNPVVALDGRRAGREAQRPRDQVQREPDAVQGRAGLQGQLSRVDDRGDRGVPGGERAAPAPGVRSRHGDDDGGQGRDRTGHQGDGGREGTVRRQGVPAGHRGLLHRPQGQHAVVPVQQLDGRPVHQPRRLQESGTQSRSGAEDLEGA